MICRYFVAIFSVSLGLLVVAYSLGIGVFIFAALGFVWIRDGHVGGSGALGERVLCLRRVIGCWLLVPGVVECGLTLIPGDPSVVLQALLVLLLAVGIGWWALRFVILSGRVLYPRPSLTWDREVWHCIFGIPFREGFASA